MATLNEFFENMAPFLRGDLTPEGLFEKIGTSPSGPRRMALYQRMVANDVANIINKMYAEFKSAYDKVRPQQWRTLLGAYTRKNPAHHWHINRVAEPFPAFIAKEREVDTELPYYFEEIADYCWTRYLCMSCPETTDDSNIIDKTVFVRQYTSTVPQYVIKSHDDPEAPLPEPGATLIILYRSHKTNKAHTIYPTVPGLLALARRTNTSPELLAQFTQVPKELIDKSEEELVNLGVLRPVTA